MCGTVDCIKDFWLLFLLFRTKPTDGVSSVIQYLQDMRALSSGCSIVNTRDKVPWRLLAMYCMYPVPITNLDRFSGSICVQATDNFAEPTAEQTIFVQCQFVWWIMGLFVPRGTVCLQQRGANVCCNQSSGFSLWSCLRKDYTKDV